jgi:hypothetical protein
VRLFGEGEGSVGGSDALDVLKYDGENCRFYYCYYYHVEKFSGGAGCLLSI